MKMVNFGIVGTGLIAGVIARSIAASSRSRLVAVSSRSQESADAFAANFPGVAAVEGVDALLKFENIDALYVATPTSAKEAIVLAALTAGIHVLVDKPFTSAVSVQRMIDVATAGGLVLMDATHFVHHPRTVIINSNIPELVGGSRTLNTAFHTSFSDRFNIRFDTDLEPMGALGDMGWYAMRAVVEYLQPSGAPREVAVAVERDKTTNAVIRAAGLLGFKSGELSTFDVGYCVNTAIMDLRLIGSGGVITMDDFPLDWTNSIAYQNNDIATGYWYRENMATRKDCQFIETPSDIPAQVLMIDRFAEMTHSNDRKKRADYFSATLKTQKLLDVAWEAVQRV